MENSTNNKKYGMYEQSMPLPNGKWVFYYCFRSTVKLDAAMWLFKQKDIRKAVNEGSIKFDPSYFRTKAGKVYPGVQIGAAFQIEEDFEEFEIAWNNGMAEAEIRRIKNSRQRSGGTFLAKYIDDMDRSEVFTAKELVKEFFEGEYMDEMNKLIKHTEEMVKVREQDYGTVSDHEVAAYEHNQMNYES